MKTPHISRTPLIILSVLAVSGISGAVGGVIESSLQSNAEQNKASVSTSTVSKANLASSQSRANTLSSLVSQVDPAIVNITTTSTTYSFFGGPITEQGAGTGMILTSNGYILTNNHVLPIDAQNVTVATSSGKQYSAQIVATDSKHDLALIKINASGLSTVTLGDSNQINVGDDVLAIGNALGQFQNSVTQGIISGLNRSVVASDSSSFNGESLSGLIQTDAPINPGDSGGPLIDLASGTVIGLDTATASNSQGIGFAIPINQAKAFLAPYLNLVSS